MKTLRIALAALAIGAGSLMAGLTTEDFARLCEFERKAGYPYLATKFIANVECYVFGDKEDFIFFVPVDVATYDDAVAAALGSHVTAAHLVVAAYNYGKDKYAAGYAEGYAKGKQDAGYSRPEPEVRKAIPITAAK